MRTITKVLCAIDLTKASHNGFDRALSIARVSKARLYILHAVPTNYRFSWHQSERLELLQRWRLMKIFELNKDQLTDPDKIKHLARCCVSSRAVTRERNRHPPCGRQTPYLLFERC